jgi:serpin B
VANQLFGQESYEFRPAFLAEVNQYFGAPLQQMAFSKDPAGATHEINNWVSEQTQNKILDLIPQNTLTKETRLVLANALYFKAAWAYDFHEHSTAQAPFYVNGGSQTMNVPTMRKTEHLRYHNGPGFQAVTLPYVGRRLHFLLIVPESADGLPAVEASLTPDLLLACAKADSREVILYLPKFKITPPTAELSDMLQTLGMTTAFDKPRGSADFDASAQKLPEDYLYISNVLHKTFFEIDEKGTEAAAATAIMAVGGCAPVERPKPITLKADRPFLFAIQHAESGACLFLGRVNDPR